MAKRQNPDQIDFFGILPANQRPPALVTEPANVSKKERERLKAASYRLKRKTPKALRTHIGLVSPEWGIAHSITHDIKLTGAPRRVSFWENAPKSTSHTQTGIRVSQATQDVLFTGNVFSRIKSFSMNFALPGPDIKKPDARRLADAFPESIKNHKRPNR
jgi:hypothetical protein